MRWELRETKDYKYKNILSDKMNKEVQKLIDQQQQLIDKLCLEIINIRGGKIKIPVAAK